MDRKELIVHTARRVIVANGLYDASIGKIAKEAGIPIGSVYTYFESKEALINYIFREIKLEMGQYIFAPIGASLPIKEEMKVYWLRAVEFGLAHAEKFFFAEQFANSPMISVVNKEQVQQEFTRLFQLLEAGAQSKLFKNLDVFLLHQIIYTNITGIIKYFAQSAQDMDANLKNTLFESCWDSIKL